MEEKQQKCIYPHPHTMWIKSWKNCSKSRTKKKALELTTWGPFVSAYIVWSFTYSILYICEWCIESNWRTEKNMHFAQKHEHSQSCSCSYQLEFFVLRVRTSVQSGPDLFYNNILTARLWDPCAHLLLWLNPFTKNASQLGFNEANERKIIMIISQNQIKYTFTHKTIFLLLLRYWPSSLSNSLFLSLPTIYVNSTRVWHYSLLRSNSITTKKKKERN